MYILQYKEFGVWKELYRCKYRKPLEVELKRINNPKYYRIVCGTEQLQKIYQSLPLDKLLCLEALSDLGKL